MGADWVTEAFEDDFAQVFEQKSFADAQLGNRVRHKDLFRLRVGAETSGQLNCRFQRDRYVAPQVRRLRRRLEPSAVGQGALSHVWPVRAESELRSEPHPRPIQMRP